MKSQLIKFWVLSLLTFTFACGNGEQAATETTEADPTEEMESMATEVTETKTETETMGNESYQITVLKGDLPSPRKEMKGTAGDVEVTVNYGSPAKKDRVIWGELIPYGQIWRTGANEATTFEVTQDVMIEGQKLPAGKYALATIPNEDGWAVIFNAEAEQWGTYEWDDAKNVLKVMVTPQTTETIAENLDFKVEGNAVVLVWDNLAVPFKVSAS